ncbi:hypothetical protein M1116_03935 [Patescibacteria group bacterium]|nr:hypothetical protein [Patescibacteria group bacterium]
MVLFYGGTIVGLLLTGWYFGVKAKGQHLLAVTGIMIVIYRVFTALTLRFFGPLPGWYDERVRKVEHWELGIGLVILGILAGKRISKKLQMTILGMGCGMLIDEISEYAGWFHLELPAHFRDSIQDIVLISASYVLFAALYRLTSERWKGMIK